MARKAAYDERTEMSAEDAEALVRRTARALDPKARGARRRQLEKDLQADKPTAAILPIYLNIVSMISMWIGLAIYLSFVGFIDGIPFRHPGDARWIAAFVPSPSSTATGTGGDRWMR